MCVGIVVFPGQRQGFRGCGRDVGALQKQKSDVHSPRRVILPSNLALVKTSDLHLTISAGDMHALIRV